MTFLAKIAVELRQAVARRAREGAPATAPVSQLLGRGDGWSVEDLLCTSGRRDRSFEEQHSGVSIAIVLAGSFQYRTGSKERGAGHLMTPGSLLLGSPKQSFECSHDHGDGDRCLSFHFTSDYFECIAADCRLPRSQRGFPVARLPLLREFSPLIAHAGAAMAPGAQPQPPSGSNARWEELGLHLAALAVSLANGAADRQTAAIPGAMARVTRVVRGLEDHPELDPSIRRLAQEAGLSPYHFLRTFQKLVGVTPHQYIRRTRLRRAAAQLLVEQNAVLDVVMDCGFGDVSNFNRAFRSEFDMNPRQFRLQGARSPAYVPCASWQPGENAICCSGAQTNRYPP